MGDADATEMTSEQIMKLLLAQGKAIETLLKAPKTAATAATPQAGAGPNLDVTAVDVLARSMEVFAYEENMDATFDRWYERHRTVFEKDAVGLEDAVKVRLMLKKLDPVTYNRYANLLLPMKPEDLSLDDTKTQLTKYFGRKESTFAVRRRCFLMRRTTGQELHGYAAEVNREAERFDLSTFTIDNLKCLMFACGLDRPEDQSYRKLVLEKMEKESTTKLDDLLSLCERLSTITSDSKQIEQNTSQRMDINMLQKRKTSKPTLDEQSQRQPWRKQQKDRSSRNGSDDEDELQCWNCLGPHMAKNCTRRRMECFGCGQLGHRKQFCREARTQRPMVGSLAITRQGKREENRCYADVEVNGRPTKLLVDTGADLTVITKKTWQKLGSPKLQGGVKAADGVNGSPIMMKGSFTCSFRQSSRKEVHHGRCHVLASDNGLDVMGNGWLATLGYMDQLKSRLNGKSQADQQCVKKIGRRKLKLSREGNKNELPQTGTKSLPKQYRPAEGSRRTERAQVPKKAGRWNRQLSNLTRTEDRQLGQAAHVNTVLRSSINGGRKDRSQEAVTLKTRNEVLQRKSEAVSQNVSELKIKKGRNSKLAVNDKPRQTRTPKSRAEQREDGLRVNTLFTLPTSKEKKTGPQRNSIRMTEDQIMEEREDSFDGLWKGLCAQADKMAKQPAKKVQLSNLTSNGKDGKKAVYEDRMDTGQKWKRVARTRKDTATTGPMEEVCGCYHEYLETWTFQVGKVLDIW